MKKKATKEQRLARADGTLDGKKLAKKRAPLL